MHLRDIFRNYFMPSGTTMFGIGALFVLAVVLFPVLAILVFRSIDNPLDGDGNHMAERIAEKSRENEPLFSRQQNNNFHLNLPVGESNSPRTPPAAITPAAPRASMSSPASSPNDARSNWKNYIREMSGPSVFVVPDVVRSLGLDEDQQRQIQEIIDAVSKALKNLDFAGKPNDPQKYARQKEELLETGRQRAMKILTKEQLESWKKFADERPQNNGKRPPETKVEVGTPKAE
jgi:hypothetical protein